MHKYTGSGSYKGDFHTGISNRYSIDHVQDEWLYSRPSSLQVKQVQATLEVGPKRCVVVLLLIAAQ